MPSQVAFDERVGNLLLNYARMVVARGYIHNTLGNVAVRVPHPAFPDGVVYTKPAEISLEEVALEDVVITDVPTGTLLHGNKMTSVGHQLNREIFRLRPDPAAHHAHRRGPAEHHSRAARRLEGHRGPVPRLGVRRLALPVRRSRDLPLGLSGAGTARRERVAVAGFERRLCRRNAILG